MFKKPLETLLNEEIATLLKNNSDLRERLEERAIDNAGYWVGEYLDGLPYKAADWSISYGYEYYDYFRIENVDSFLQWYDDVNRAYCLFSDSDRETIDELKRINDIYKHCDELYWYGFSPYTGKTGGIKEKEYQNIEKKREEMIETVNRITFKALRAEIDYYLEYRSGKKLDSYLVSLWYDFAECELEYYGCEWFTDHNLTNIYEYEPAYYVPAHTVAESKNLVI